jgi:pre-rRNA-processing protein IPI3
MLTEHFVASIHTPLRTQASGSKDISIFVNELQPLAGQRQTFKKSATVQNCLAVSDTHIFAAQAEKAVVHVYNRERGNHEATIPFNEKITSLALAASDAGLLLGTEGGRILAWEVGVDTHDLINVVN